MNRTLRILALVGSLAAGPALAADNGLIVTNGSGVTLRSVDIGAGVQAPGHALVNATGTQIGISGAPLFVQAPSGAIASGAVASGAYASGSIASGAFASGALASGSVASGAMVDLGAQADSACATDNGSCSLIALQKRGNQNLTTLNTTAGTAGTLQAAATGGASTTGNIAANNTTAVVIKASAGTLYGVQLYGIGSAPAYLKIYNATSATCGSGTPVKRLMIPAASTAANGAGSNISFGDIGVAFGTGITYCVTTGIGDADTTAPAASTFLVNVDFK